MTRAQQLADAVLGVARVNHYMVGVIEHVTQAEVDEARQILIDRQNALRRQKGKAYTTLDLALDLLERPIMHGMVVKPEDQSNG